MFFVWKQFQKSITPIIDYFVIFLRAETEQKHNIFSFFEDKAKVVAAVWGANLLNSMPR